MLFGCTTTPPPIEQRAEPPLETVPQQTQESQESVPVTRYGRYALIELVPEPAQRDLMQQVIEVSVPPSLDATVGDGLRHVLLRTGYRLCETAEATALYALPLPAAHLHLGPLLLRDALVTLAGPAWELSIDDTERQVCFLRAAKPRPTNASPVQNNPAPATAAAGAAPAASAQPEEARP
jgi:conjugative transfer region protein (TIGR03748 family)